MGGQDVPDAALEGQRIFAETEAGIKDPAGGVVQECQKHRLASLALCIGNGHGVHAVGLHAFQRGKELEGQRFLPVMLAQASLSIQSRGAHQA